MPDEPTIDLSFYERFLTWKGLNWEESLDGGIFYQNLSCTFALLPDAGDRRRFRMVMPWLRPWEHQEQPLPERLSMTIARRCPDTLLAVRHAWLLAEIEANLESPAVLGAVFGRCTTRLVEASGIVRAHLGPAPGELPWKPAGPSPSIS